MRAIDLITTALRNLQRQKLRSILTIFAVVIGATSVTIMLALVTGAKGFFISQFSANGTLQQVAVSSKTDLTKFNDNSGGGNSCDSCVKLSDDLVNKIKALPHVTGVARRLSAGAFEAIIYNGTPKLSLNQIVGYDANGILTNTMLVGRDISSNDTTGVVTVTSDYADKWGFKGHYGDLIGQPVQLLSRTWYQGVGAVITPPSNQPGDHNGPRAGTSTTLTATVVGVSDATSQSASVRAPLAWVRQMNEQQMYQQTDADRQAQQAECQGSHGPCNPQPHFTLVVTDMLATNGYDALTAKAATPANAAAVAASIRKLGVGAADAESFIQAQLQIFNIISLVLGGIGGIALAVAAIGVVNTMVMAILERTREIGVMRACGATRATIRRLFTIEAGLLGCLGGVVGVAAGYGLTYVANILINRQLLAGSVQAKNIIGLPLWLIAAVIGATTIIGMLAGLYPAFRAARLNPVEALRYE
ncbi:MAG TPA: ABC transporter permease [Candidatus Saccharimonadia bacterium]|nr:ABC transporter permease [Candidatus Saccharimonadia bacterium]